MANKVDNIYVELFENLKIPKRLEPENIAAMLAEKAAQTSNIKTSRTKNYTPSISAKRSEQAETSERNITITSNIRKTSTTFRMIASIAACAALAFGMAGYMGVFDKKLPQEPPKSGAQYAEDYDTLHKTFEEYYVGSEDKRTLDSAIADIEHSYNDNENESHPDSALTPKPSEDDSETIAAAPSVTESNVPDNVSDPPAEETAPEIEEIYNDEDAPDSSYEEIKLPEQKAKSFDGEVLFGLGFMAEQNGDSLRIYSTDGGKIALTDTVMPFSVPGTDKTLLGFYTDNLKLTVVYSVANSAVYAYDPAANGMLGTPYGAPTSASASGYSVEVVIYSIVDGRAVLNTDFTQDGSLVDMNFQNGSLYLATAYNDYRNTPIIGVEDLQSYVPGYTVNGIRNYIDPQNIMIPEYLSTTDYTVISGITTDGAVSVQAVLGYEGRVILKEGAVYLFGYDTTSSGDVTSAKVFSLANGQVIYSGYKDIDGVALSGDGISLFGSSIAITSVSSTLDGYVTTLAVYDGTMELISRVSFQGVALTNVKRVGNMLYLSGASESGVAIDLSNPAQPEWSTENSPKDDITEGLVEIDGGYVTLTLDDSGELLLSKLSKDDSGNLVMNYSTVLCEDGGRSKALDNNGILFVSGSTVGVPYGFFDGLDYCFKYALYRASSNGFELLGEIENHEVDEVFENGKAYLNNGYLYIFSDGRVYCASTKDGLSVVSTANLIQSAYSGHR